MSAIVALRSQQHGQGILDEALEGRQQVGADRAVDDPVIAGERAAHHRGDVERAVPDHRTLFAGADREDTRLGRVDDRVELLDAVHAEIGEAEAAALVFLGHQLAVARAAAASSFISVEIVDQPLGLGAADDRRDQPAVDRDRDRDVDRL